MNPITPDEAEAQVRELRRIREEALTGNVEAALFEALLPPAIVENLHGKIRDVFEQTIAEIWVKAGLPPVEPPV